MDFNFLARDVASRLHHRGSFLSPEHADVGAFLKALSAFEPSKDQFEIRKLDILSAFSFTAPTQDKPFAFADGMAIIPITGILVNRMSWSSSFATGYGFIRSQMQAALDDDDVDLIVYDVNSPGGVSSGCAELAQEMFDSRSAKPSLAVVDSMAYSAAYFLASAASRIAVAPSGGVGSIGCVAMHVDLSGMLAEDGVKITFIQAGDLKTDGNPYQPLSARAKENIQQDVDYHYGIFTDAVAKQRDMPSEDVRNTEAATYLPPEALDIGLVDVVETPSAALARFRANGGDGMTGTRSAASNSSEDWKCGAARDLPVKESGSWDGPAAAERMFDAAGFNGSSPNATEARAGFLAYDADDPTKKGSYKLPFADIVDGKKTAVRSGLNAAAQRLSNTNIPSSVKDEAQKVIDGYKPKTDSKEENEMDRAVLSATVASAVATALAAERTRQSGIRTSPEATGREKLADHLSNNTDMTVEAAVAILAASPKEVPAAQTGTRQASGFAAAMDSTKNPNIKADGGTGGPEGDTPVTRATRLLNVFSKGSGKTITLEQSTA